MLEAKLAVPWFAFAFVGGVLFDSLRLLSSGIVAVAAEIDTFFLAMAMAALGLATHLGVKPLLLAAILFVWLVMGGALINRRAPALLA